MEYAGEPRGLAGLHAERDDVLDLEVDRIADADAVAQSLFDDLDRRPFDAEHLADEGCEARHGATQLAAEHAGQLRHLLVGRAVVDEDPDAPVPLGHHLRCICNQRERAPAHVCALDLALANVEDERDAAVVVRRTVIEREVARAHELAGTGLEVGSLDAPGHAILHLQVAGNRFFACRGSVSSAVRSSRSSTERAGGGARTHRGLRRRSPRRVTPSPGT